MNDFVGIDEYVRGLPWKHRLRVWLAGFKVRRKAYALGLRDGIQARPIAIRDRAPSREDGCQMWQGQGERNTSILVWCPGGGGYWTVAWWNCDRKGVTHWLPLVRPESEDAR
jgi:hypothetical protein